MIGGIDIGLVEKYLEIEKAHEDVCEQLHNKINFIHENIKKFCNADNKEKKYLTSQMIDNRFYKISDIITDVPVEHIEK